MTAALANAIEAALARRPTAIRGLAGGCIGEVFRLDFVDRPPLVAKWAPGGGGLDLEGWMLAELGSRSPLPVPDVICAEPELLVMSWLDGRPGIAGAEAEAAHLIAGQHQITADRFGLDQDTVIGGLNQPNGWMDGWIDFFRERRLLYMTRQAVDAGRLPTVLVPRLERLAASLAEHLPAASAPSLVHGDLWTGNILSADGRVTGVVDPAIYYADAEIELAFGTLFGTFNRRFFDCYQDHRTIAPGFFEVRRYLYNLYPLLVHVRLFGGGYAGDVARVLDRLGY